jgi:hypothetical protein
MTSRARRPLRALAGLAGPALVSALAAAPAAACEVCFGAARDSGSPLVSGARLGVFLLLGITVAVLGSFVAFFLYLRQRAQRAELDGIESEWAQLQRSTST